MKYFDDISKFEELLKQDNSETYIVVTGGKLIDEVIQKSIEQNNKSVKVQKIIIFTSKPNYERNIQYINKHGGLICQVLYQFKSLIDELIKQIQNYESQQLNTSMESLSQNGSMVFNKACVGLNVVEMMKPNEKLIANIMKYFSFSSKIKEFPELNINFNRLTVEDNDQE